MNMLMAWQAKRVRAHVEVNISARLGVADLAQVVDLSPSHFCRLFKEAFGLTVHRYVMHQRLELAQRLMLQTSESLSSIALSCGMSDQSHLTRCFHRLVGETPAEWRRARYATLNGRRSNSRTVSSTASGSHMSMRAMSSFENQPTSSDSGGVGRPGSISGRQAVKM